MGKASSETKAVDAVDAVAPKLAMALEKADRGSEFTGCSASWALDTLAAEVRRLQAAQREPVAWRYRLKPKGPWTLTSTRVEDSQFRDPSRYEWEPLYTQAQRDDHPTEGLRDWRKDAEGALRCASLSRKKATITLLQRLLAKLDAALGDK